VDNPATGIWFSDKDSTIYILDKPLINEPGTSFNYGGGNYMSKITKFKILEKYILPAIV